METFTLNEAALLGAIADRWAVAENPNSRLAQMLASRGFLHWHASRWQITYKGTGVKRLAFDLIDQETTLLMSEARRVCDVS